ncbi:MAG: hypothetical protein GXP55_24130 [Deltaproteobacteria bacterium]|nr:hypothetical protein [Deltaproteobacteria bacterium]
MQNHLRLVLPLSLTLLLGLAGLGCSAGGGGGGGSCSPGLESCECAAGGRCLEGLSCLSGRCVDTGGGVDGGGRDGGGFDSGGGGFDSGARDGSIPDGGIPDVGPNPDAFFAMDPPPRLCLEDGGTGPVPDPPGGTPDCPDDKNREGCRCEGVGTTAPCWPGLRVNRDRGICRDGTTTCEAFDEFTGRWGACVGAVLPDPSATLGPSACRCFSAGRWAIDNLSPCFVDYGGRGVYAVSTYIAGAGAQCPTLPASAAPPPTPEPGTDWSTDRLTVDCEGRFQLCYTLKAGNADTPSPSDCTVARVCTETWYTSRDMEQELPPLPSWTSSDAACARQFRDSGGYGEMSVTGLSVECDPIDDGSGGEYVFNRVNYCPADCASRPTAPECAGCMMGGSGGF